MNETFLLKKLEERRQQNAFRTLRLPTGKIDFCSNNYLGIVKRSLVMGNGSLYGEEMEIENRKSQVPNYQLSTDNYQLSSGSTGSRLLAGNYSLIEELEQQIAAFHQSQSALIFNSGYDGNIGLLSCVAQKGDTILYDFLSHASIRDGIRLSQAQAFAFLHNNLVDLERRLQQTVGNIFVVTESVFSMDGDTCPLPEIVALCQQYNAHLIIDEAHATGVIGNRGEGLVQQLNLQEQVFARVHTFGKACGCHGAVVLGSSVLRDYLINFARPFIYSTSLPPHAMAIIKKSYEIFPLMMAERTHLQSLINYFQTAAIAYEKLPSQTPIQVVIIEGNGEVKTVANLLQENGLDVRPILYPTVPKGKERLRIVLHSFNTLEEVKRLVELLK